MKSHLPSLSVAAFTLPLLASAALFVASAVAAQVIVVDTIDDRADPPFHGLPGCGQGSLSDLPGADGRISLREAIIAANNTAGVQSIRFAPALLNRTIRVTFDSSDPGSEPNPLPRLCSGGTSIDGDINGDGTPDISIDGNDIPAGFVGIEIASSNNTVAGLRLVNFDFGIYLAHARGGEQESVRTGNLIRNNRIEGARFAIYMVAGEDGGDRVGALSQTAIRGNAIVGSVIQGIYVSLENAGSSIDGLEIVDNEIRDAQASGILMAPGLDESDTILTNVVVARNEIVRNQGPGIFLGPTQNSRRTQMTGIRIEDNHFDNPLSPGIYVIGGICSASDNNVAVTIQRNDFAALSDGVRIEAGANVNCGSGIPDAVANRVQAVIHNNQFSRTDLVAIDLIAGNGGARLNQIDADVAGNVIDGPTQTGIRAFGGIRTTSGNRVNLTATGNVITDSEGSGIELAGGAASDQTGIAQDNRVVGTLRNNRITRSGSVGIALVGAYGDRVRSNRVDAVLDENRSCGSETSDVRCSGFAANPPVADASNNLVVAQVSDTQAASVIIDPQNSGGSCSVQQSGTRPCSCQGDCGSNGTVTVDEVITLVNIALGSSLPNACVAGDANGDGEITVEEIVGALISALSGC